jgi:Cu-Zn family superoxide dismutase
MMKTRRKIIARGSAGLALALAVGGACWAAAPVLAEDGAAHAAAVLRDTAGNEVGFARFTEDATGRVHVNVHVGGMSPGLHGIHIHSVGNCTSGADAFSGAGSHHNPAGRPHGQHAGDLPNLVVNDAGRGQLTVPLERFTFAADAAILDADGSAIVVHALPDDFTTQPTGGSGARIACGVINPG